MKYQVGDKVRIVSGEIDYWDYRGEIDKWVGKVMTIASKDDGYYTMVEDNGRWFWFEDMIAGLAEGESSKEEINTANKSELDKIINSKQGKMKYKPNDKVVFFNIDKVKLESGKIMSANANYRENNYSKRYLDVNYNIQTDNFFYIGIDEKLIFNNKKEFYDMVGG